MSVIQIGLLILIGLFFIRTVRLSGDEALVPSRLLWGIFWVGAAAMVAWPDVLSRLADVVGVGRGVDLAMYVIILGLIFIVFRLWVRMYVLESHITTLVRHIALDERQDRDV